MRLTLRTLLAYLDDTLDGAQVKQIGLKVAESDTAQELIARIKQVTRRRRLTTPPPTGTGSKLDANTIAEYLENKLSEDQVAEVEQVCLGSDVHLAELAACHQLLTLILGEPMLIPPTSRQRMYGLVKGREAIPFRKPKTAPSNEEKTREDSYQQDEILRLGLPAWRQRSSWASRLTLLGGTLAACLLLALAIYQATRPPEHDDSNGTMAAGSGDKKPSAPPDIQPGPGAGKKTVTQPEPKGNGTDKPDPNIPDDKTKPKPMGNGTDKPDPKVPVPPPQPPPPAGLKIIAIAAPKTAVKEVGKFERNPSPLEPSILLQKVKQAAQPGKWQHVDVLNPKVYTGAFLVSLPGYQSQIALKGDALLLKLQGALPEETPQAALAREAMVEIHQHEEVDLDLTLHRGKIVLVNRKDKPAQIRLRFSNPTDPDLGEVWDLLLKEKGTEIFVERNTAIAPGEQFYEDKDHPSRKGPVAAIHVIVREGKVDLRRQSVTHTLQKPPGEARFYWVSSTGAGKQKLDEVPDYAADKTDFAEPKLPADVKPDMKKQILDYHKRFLETRQKMTKARKKLADEMLVNADKIDAVLKSLVKSNEYADRILAVRCYGSLDKLSGLVDALATRDLVDVRRCAIDTLRRWVSYERDNDYLLFKALSEQQYSSLDSISIITMLHGFSPQDALTSAAIYEALIPKLNDPKMALRELAGLHLYVELQKHFPAPIGDTIQYSPDGTEAERAAAEEQWHALLKAGKLPPRIK